MSVIQSSRLNTVHNQDDCDTIEAEIDRLVYELYGLTEQEIGIVEGERGIGRDAIQS